MEFGGFKWRQANYGRIPFTWICQRITTLHNWNWCNKNSSIFLSNCLLFFLQKLYECVQPEKVDSIKMHWLKFHCNKKSDKLLFHDKIKNFILLLFCYISFLCRISWQLIASRVTIRRQGFPRIVVSVDEETRIDFLAGDRGGFHVDEQIPRRRIDVYCNYCSGRVCSRWSDQVGGQRRPILGDCPPGVGPKVSRSLEALTTKRKLCPALWMVAWLARNSLKLSQLPYWASSVTSSSSFSSPSSSSSSPSSSSPSSSSSSSSSLRRSRGRAFLLLLAFRQCRR